MKTLKFRIYDKDAKKFHYLESVFNMPDPCYDGEVQQYIGLLDENGKEIYEGDVIINPYIISLECSYCDKPYNENKPKVVKWDRHDSRWSVPMIDMGQNYRILGNICENPELLPILTYEV